MSAVDDYKRLLASYPKGQYIIDTFEIYHPLISQRYFLTNDTDDVTATDESSNVRTYESTQIKVDLNDTSDDLDQNFRFTFADLNNVWDDEIDRVPLGDTTPMSITYRSYVSTNLSEPSVVYRLFVLNISQSHNSITLDCGANQLNWHQTGVVYDFDTFPMMRGLI